MGTDRNNNSMHFPLRQISPRRLSPRWTDFLAYPWMWTQWPTLNSLLCGGNGIYNVPQVGGGWWGAEILGAHVVPEHCFIWLENTSGKAPGHICLHTAVDQFSAIIKTKQNTSRNIQREQRNSVRKLWFLHIFKRRLCSSKLINGKIKANTNFQRSCLILCNSHHRIY